MSVFTTLGALLRNLSAQGAATLETLVSAIRSLCADDRENRRRVAFSVAMIALSAKMAKADGVVTPAEIAVFRRIFAIPPRELRNVSRLYDLAKQDTAGFEAYARRMRTLCGREDGDCLLLTDVLDGLFQIAGADDVVHERELAFLEQIAALFGLSEAEFDQVKARHVQAGPDSAFAVLGVDPADPPETVRRRYLELVRENHPDRMMARGVPQEFLAIATERMKAINSAWATLSRAAAA